jgi:hypothetical protein
MAEGLVSQSELLLNHKKAENSIFGLQPDPEHKQTKVAAIQV